jgi:hypothetical protein
MPGPYVFIYDSDLYDRIGGQAAFVQLLDPNGTGTWNPDVSLKARGDACNLVIEAAGVPVDLSGLTIPDFRDKFPNLITWASLKGLAMAWLYGAGGQAMPAGFALYDQQANAGIEMLAVRRRKHGAIDFNPGAAQAVRGSINLDPYQTKMTMDGFRTGFC